MRDFLFLTGFRQITCPLVILRVYYSRDAIFLCDTIFESDLLCITYCFSISFVGFPLAGKAADIHENDGNGIFAIAGLLTMNVYRLVKALVDIFTVLNAKF